MAAAVFSKSVVTINCRGRDNTSASCIWKSSSRSIPNGFATNVKLSRKGIFSAGQSKLRVVHTSTSHALVMDQISCSSDDNKDKPSSCVDVPLTKKGIDEAIEAGVRIRNLPIDVIYTSTLIRAQMTAMLTMTQHRKQKVPIIKHNDSEQAKTWSQIYSEETKKQSIPVTPAWQLNERMYGELQGLNKQETAERYGKELVHEWRRSFDIPPPNGESLEMCSKRAVAYFREHVINLELSTGILLLYIYKDGNFLKRGSPVGHTEATVYAYTASLAL